MTTTERAADAATAAAAVLPATEPLTAGAAVAGTAETPTPFAGAAVCDLDLPGRPRIAILVGAELVEALAGSPLGGLDLAAASQPALDAAAASLGTTAQPGRAVELELVATDLGGPFTAVPLVGASGAAGALLLPDTLLDAQSDQADAPDTPDAGFAALPGMPASRPMTAMSSRGIEMLHGVDMEVTVELGRTQMTVRDLLALSPGTVLELDRAAGSPADLLVNGRLIARGEVVVVDEDFGLRVTEIVDESAAS